MINKKAIGFFDSGIGGLTLLNCAYELLPEENYIYYGDNKNAPYGNKSKNEILYLVNKAFKYFQKKHVKAVVIACNTVTAECAMQLRNVYNFKIIGIEPAVKPAERNGGNVAVLCTCATANSEKFKKLINEYNNIDVFPQTNLAEIIENNIFCIDKIDLSPLIQQIKNYDNTVLGCTHYIFIKEVLKKYGINNIFDGNEGTANYLKKFLINNKLLNEKGGKIVFKGSGKSKNSKLYKSIKN